MTTTFIEKAKLVHGDKYDYSKVVYENNLKEVLIICKDHGEFLQQPKTHKRGNGCIQCGTNSRAKRSKTTDEFILQSTQLHNNKYDYSKVKYINAIKKVIIICKEHGEFLQSPNGHLSNGGCKKCALIIISNKHRSNIHEFIDRAIQVHGDNYDYSKSKYINNHSKVIIICKEHGEFLQQPIVHINHRCGCPTCSHILTGDILRSNTHEFIDKSFQVHGNKYDYSKSKYIDIHSKVIIICKEHGEFLQQPISHMKGFGCSKCAGCCKLTTKEFIEKAIQVHGYKYDYSKVDYIKTITKVIIICKEHGEFLQQPNNHLNGQNCPNCRIPNYSKKQIQWLECISKLKSIRIQHAMNESEYTIPTTNLKADGFCKETNTIYEFHGDFWHGNPKLYNSEHINPVNKKTFGELYQHTISRESQIKELGYNLFVLWEYDWNKSIKSIRYLQQQFRYRHK
jgi:hypothetical protein